MERDNLCAHSIVNVDPQICVQKVLAFCKDKPDPEIMYSTTTIVVGTKKAPFLIAGQPQQFPIINTITSCLIMWFATKKEFEQWELDRVKLHQDFMKEQMK